MVFDLILLIFFQPFLGYVFVFLPPLIIDFLNNNLKPFKLKLFTLTFLTDLIFIKPFGFFLFLTAISFLILYFLNRFISYHFLWQGFIFIFVFNLVFINLFLFFLGQRLFTKIFWASLISNIIFQGIYFIFINLFSHDRRRFNFSAIRQES